MIFETLLNLGLLLLFLLLGVYILLRGYRASWATLGILGFWVTANMLAVFVAGVANGRELWATQDWTLLGLSLGAGVLGAILGRFLPGIAMSVIGFIAGADIGLWLYDISAYIVTDLANLSEQTSIVIGLIIILIGGLVGLWFVRQMRDEGLILITVIIGVELIQGSLRFNPASSWTAVVILGLALAGVLVQYADYMRGIKASATADGPPMPQSSMAQFQDLELES